MAMGEFLFGKAIGQRIPVLFRAIGIEPTQ